MKTTLKHQTKTGNIDTRKTEREYTHVVVRCYTTQEAERDIESARRSAERYEADRQYMLANIDKAETRVTGEYVLRGEYEMMTTDESWYDLWIARNERNAESAAANAGLVFVASWHGSAMLAAKAADKLRARGFRGIAVEEINGGVRETVAA